MATTEVQTELDIPAWMLDPPAVMAAAARDLTALATRVAAASRTLEQTLDDTATTLGWQGQIEGRAAAVVAHQRPLLTRYADAAAAAGQALADLAAAADEQAPGLGQLLTDLATLQRNPPTRPGAPTHPFVDLEELGRQTARLTAEIGTITDELRRRETWCQAALARVEADLQALMPAGSMPNWTGSMLPSAAFGVLQQHGVVDTKEERSIALSITVATTPQHVREALADLPTERLEGFLARHPLAVAILADDHHPITDDPELTLLRRTSEGHQCGPFGPPLGQVAATAEYWRSLTPQQQHRLRLLYPAYIGNLDGVDLETRALANRMLMRDALVKEQAMAAVLAARLSSADMHAVVEDGVDEHIPTPVLRYVVKKSFGFLQSDPGAMVLDIGPFDPDRRLANSRSRIDFYTSLLLDQPVAAHGSITVPAQQRMVLVFDPRDDGRFAEWQGRLDAANVGVFVPGTSSDMASAGSFLQRISTIVSDGSETTTDSTADTAMIIWLGTDFPSTLPDAVATAATVSGGHHLAAFVEGLGAQERTLTLVGHSAGGAMVGQADLLGVNVDRVVHVASAGTGPGVDHADKYPTEGIGGTSRAVDRFSMTAPGDVIEVAQQAGVFDWLVPDTWGHGYDPDSTPGFYRLETGRGADGQQLRGPFSHDAVIEPGTDAFDNWVAVIRGEPLIPHVEHLDFGPFDPYPRVRSPYADTDYPGTPPVPYPER